MRLPVKTLQVKIFKAGIPIRYLDMKQILGILPTLLFISCFNNREVDQLNQRITRLEQRLDSLINKTDKYSSGIYGTENLNGSNASFYFQFARCQKITKKGKQCRRKAKANGYCWQHG